MIPWRRSGIVVLMIAAVGCASTNHRAANPTNVELSIVMTPVASLRESNAVQFALVADHAEVFQVHWIVSGPDETIHMFPGTSTVTTPPAPPSGRITLRPTANEKQFIRRFAAMPGVASVTQSHP